MAIILHKGLLPGKKTREATCRNCGTWFRFEESEAHLNGVDPREPATFEIVCPLDGCGQMVYVRAKPL